MAIGSTDLAAAVATEIAQPPIDEPLAALKRIMRLDDGRRLGTVQFETLSPADLLPFEKQNLFASDFCCEFSQLEMWAANQNWTVPQLPDLRVAVSDRFKISKSLVPAWSGRPGHMEFPNWRVLSRKAALTHELVHVFFPNGNRLLAEGLAIYLQAQLGANPAFPNFGRPLHELVRELWIKAAPTLTSDMSPRLEQVRLAKLDAIATPSPLTLEVDNGFYGEEPRGQAHLYAVAGSFVQFLIESRGLAEFRKVYEQTPMVPLQKKAGAPGRWAAIYGHSLGELSDEWKVHIARTHELTDH